MGKKKITKRRLVAFPHGKIKGKPIKALATVNIKSKFARKFHKLEGRPRVPRIEGKSFFSLSKNKKL